MTDSTENVTPPKSTKSINSHSATQIQIKPEDHFEFVLWDTEKSVFLDLVDFGDAVFSVETVRTLHGHAWLCAFSCLFRPFFLSFLSRRSGSAVEFSIRIQQEWAWDSITIKSWSVQHVTSNMKSSHEPVTETALKLRTKSRTQLRTKSPTKSQQASTCGFSSILLSLFRRKRIRQTKCVCCFVLFNRFWGIVTVPGFPQGRAKEHVPTKQIANVPPRLVTNPVTNPLKNQITESLQWCFFI